MNQMKQLLDKLDEIISLETVEPIERLGGYIVGDLASDLEISNGSTSQLQAMWIISSNLLMNSKGMSDN